MTDADFLIIGAGAAGCVLANRLSESGRSSVVLLEAGRDVTPGSEPADITNVFPLSSFNNQYMWPDTRVHWRRSGTGPAAMLPQGRLIGGSSQVMGMWAMRGNPGDYDGWAQGGASGWSWREVLPYFKRLETDIDYDGPLHGRHGPLPIRRESPGARTALARAIHAETMARGWADIADMNADFADGHCTMPVTREDNARASAGLHYLTAQVRSRANLVVQPDCTAERLLIEDGQVVGARVTGPDGVPRDIRARETIVTAGALRSPVLLMRSGIGPPDMLRAANIPVVHALPGVGRNLRNHAAVYIVGVLTNAGLDPPGWRPAASTCLRWTTGVDGTSPSDMAMYVRSYLSWHALGRRMASLAPCLMRPLSAGQITLQASATGVVPLIEFDMLSDPRDLQRIKDGVKLAVDLFGSVTERGLSGPPVILADASGLARYNTVSRWNALRSGAAAALMRFAPALGDPLLGKLANMVPAAAIAADDAALTEFVQTAISGTGHVCGTCRIGPASDSLAVVDQAGRVHGMPGLIVADASIMPDVPAANTHVPVVMVAEKIAAELTGNYASAD